MSDKKQRHFGRWQILAGSAAALAVLAFAGYSLVYAERILPRVHIGALAVGSLTKDEARLAIQSRIAALREKGIIVEVDGVQQSIRLDSINFELSPDDATDQVWRVGRSGIWYQAIRERLSASMLETRVAPRFSYDDGALANEIAIVAGSVSHPRKDISLAIRGTRVGISYETKPGSVLDRGELQQAVINALKRMDLSVIHLELQPDVPSIDPASTTGAKSQAEAMMRKELVLVYEWRTFTISREQIGKWIISTNDDRQLVPDLDTSAISAYVTTIADAINEQAQKPVIQVEDRRVAKFVPPRTGRALQENETLALIVKELEARRDSGNLETEIALPVRTTKPTFDGAINVQGISELIGKATTPFTGSPANRVSNIKNGAKFLSGVLVQPGEEFSTLKTLGTVDNTTGYLPELVIKESETIPEFGGGLCQVSTTLFRAVLDAGLPVTERRNHSFRVSYYEKDASGAYVGPGLDATIYDIYPDLKFVNDTGSPILIYGYVEKDRLTFELYGTSDGRIAKIDGPELLSEIPPGDPVYIDTDQLPKGTVKQKEFAHPGGTTIATYTITYPDGREVKQDFKSFYRRWPAQYLVGTGK